MKTTISFETLMDAVLLQHQEDYMAGLPSGEVLAAGFTPGPGFEVKLLKEAKKQENKKYGALTILRRVAACIVLALALTSAVFVPVQAVRQAAVSTVLEWKDQFVQFIFEAGEGGKSVLPGDIELGYLPEGFEKGVITNYEADGYSFLYAAPEGDYLFIEISLDPGITTDNEHSDFYLIERNGIQYTYVDVENGYSTTLLWAQGTIICFINTTLPLNEAIKIAENISL